MRTAILLFPVVIATCLSNLSAAPYTPKPGSPERVAICDTLRSHMAEHWVSGKLLKKMVFRISRLKVDGNFAFIECSPIYEDGTEICSTVLPPIDWAFLLQKKRNRWEVIADFSSSDVPEPAWWAERKARIPKEMNPEILGESLKKQLGM